MVKLVGDGTVLDDTRGPGYGPRNYGQPLEFVLADGSDETVLRALHPCVLDMCVGGKRRVRTQLKDSEYGFLHVPMVKVVNNGKVMERPLKAEWFVDVEVELIAVLPERPKTWFASLIG